MIFDDRFPRAVSYCVHAIEKNIKRLPRGRKVMTELKMLNFPLDKHHSFKHHNVKHLEDQLSDYLNELQLKFARLHQIFTDNWFKLD